MPFNLNINWLDPVIVVLVVLALLQGRRVGFLKSFFNIAGIVAGVALAARYYSALASLMPRFATLPQVIAEIISFIVIFIFVAVVINLVGSSFYAATKAKTIKTADKIGGSLIWALAVLLITSLLLVFFNSLPVYAEFPSQVEGSMLASDLVNLTTRMLKELAGYLPLNLP